jgi:RimJ/RimL family protein N-acetyltransferase
MAPHTAPHTGPDVVLVALDEAGLADLLEAAVAGAAPAEVMPAPEGADWDDRLRAGFLAFHRGRALAAEPVERTWVVRVGGRAAGAVRVEPGAGGHEVGIWLARDDRGRGTGTAALRLLRAEQSAVASGAPLVARTTASNHGARGLLRTLGAATAPGTEGTVTARLCTVDHDGGPAGGRRSCRGC